MTAIDFCFWLQGYFEMSGSSELTKEQVKVLKNHLNLVFIHEIDPLREKQTPATAGMLNGTHLDMSPEEFEKAGRPRC